MLRYLRIAVSVVSGLCCVLVIVLWVRSAHWVDGVHGQLTSSHAIAIGLLPGSFVIGLTERPERSLLPTWAITSVQTDEWFERCEQFPPGQSCTYQDW